MTLPTSIEIGPLTYVIEEVPDLYHKGIAIFGFFNPSGLSIRVERDIPEQRKRITLWHEILHAILNHAEKGGVDDDIVSILAFGIVDVLRRNPGLMEE